MNSLASSITQNLKSGFRFGLLVKLLFTALVFLALPAKSATEAPNILFIMADDLGYGDLSLYGAADISSPNIDRIGQEGMKWTRFYANCPVCSPTRAAFLTGYFPDQVGVPGVIRTHESNSWGFLDPKTPTLAEDLRSAGYQTALVGKWHLGLDSVNHPNNRGFDHFHGWLGDMMDDYFTHRRHNINYMRLNQKTIDPEGHATDLFTQWAIQYLEGQAELSRNDVERPFFLYLAYNAPHTPIQPPVQWLERVQKSRPEISPARARLVALIEHMDAGIGEVLKTLEQTGLSSNTIVVFTSDNGGQVNVGAWNGGLRDGKQSMYEGGLRVPCLVKWPGVITKGSVTDAVGICSDWKWTLESIGTRKDWNSLNVPSEAMDLLPVLQGEICQFPERTLYFCRREGGLRYGGKTIEAVLKGNWKILQNSPFSALELYDLSVDPLEKSNLADSHPQKLAEMNQLVRAYIQAGGTKPWFRDPELSQ